MTPQEADAVVTEAMNGIMANDAVGIAAQKALAEYDDLAKIHMATLTDWTVQLAWIVADKRWDKADNALIAANLALQKLAGVVANIKSLDNP